MDLRKDRRLNFARRRIDVCTNYASSSVPNLHSQKVVGMNLDYSVPNPGCIGSDFDYTLSFGNYNM